MDFSDIIELTTDPYRSKYKDLESYDGFGIAFLLSVVKEDEYFNPELVFNQTEEQNDAELLNYIENLEKQNYIELENQEDGFEASLGNEIEPVDVCFKAMQYWSDSQSSENRQSIEQDSTVTGKIDSVWEDVRSEGASQQEVEEAMKHLEGSESE